MVSEAAGRVSRGERAERIEDNITMSHNRRYLLYDRIQYQRVLQNVLSLLGLQMHTYQKQLEIRFVCSWCGVDRGVPTHPNTTYDEVPSGIFECLTRIANNWIFTNVPENDVC